MNETSQHPDASTEVSEDRTRSTGSPAEPKPRLRWLWIVISLLLLATVIVGLGELEDTVDVSEVASPPPLQVVSVAHVSATRQRVEVRSFAEVRPRWSAELSANVSGRITTVFDAALAGEPVEAGTRLVEIENSQFVAELAASNQALMEAKLALWQARNAAKLAREDFERNRRKPPNDLALKLPQLEIAERSVVSAETRVAAAQRRLDDTTIIAPFAAYVTDRFVSPGQSVNPGDPLVKLVDRSSFELAVELSREDWALLAKPIEGREARLLDQRGKEIATAIVRRGGGFLDENTRQHRMFLEVRDSDNGAVLSGDFVTVLLPGIVIDNASDVPASAVTQEGYVWRIDEADRLVRTEPDILFRRHDRVILRVPGEIEEWRVAVTPLASFLPGQKVEPRRVEN